MTAAQSKRIISAALLVIAFGLFATTEAKGFFPPPPTGVSGGEVPPAPPPVIPLPPPDPFVPPPPPVVPPAPARPPVARQTPEPATVVSGLIGLSVFGGYILRRRCK